MVPLGFGVASVLGWGCGMPGNACSDTRCAPKHRREAATRSSRQLLHGLAPECVRLVAAVREGLVTVWGQNTPEYVFV